MSAQREILGLINRYGFTIDTGDLEGFARLFEHGEWIAEGADPVVGDRATKEALSNIKIYADGTPRTKHVTSNSIFAHWHMSAHLKSPKESIPGA